VATRARLKARLKKVRVQVKRGELGQLEAAKAMNRWDGTARPSMYGRSYTANTFTERS